MMINGILKKATRKQKLQRKEVSCVLLKNFFIDLPSKFTTVKPKGTCETRRSNLVLGDRA